MKCNIFFGDFISVVFKEIKNTIKEGFIMKYEEHNYWFKVRFFLVVEIHFKEGLLLPKKQPCF